MCSKKWITNTLVTIVMQCTLATAADAHELTAPQSTGRGGDFTLQSLNGPVSLRELRGKVVLLTFGFTSCVDVCPATLWNLSNVFSELTADELEKITALFASLDPERDTLKVLHNYTELFHSNIVGVTDREEILREVAKNYGVAFERKENPGSTLGYTIYHTLGVFVIDPRGELQEERLDLSADTREVAAGLRKLLDKYR